MPDSPLAAAPLVFYGGMSASLSGAALPAPTSPAWRVLDGAVAGARTLVAPTPAAVTRPGPAAPAHGLVWFDRIHVVPRTADLAFVLSEQTLGVEVWNAFMSRARTLSSVGVSGAAGITVDGPPATPADVPASRSTIYTVRVAPDGAATIEDVVTWYFTGVDPAGTDLTLVGVRLQPFPFPPDMGQGIREAIVYLTDVIEAYDTSEQRVQLRAHARGGMEYVPVFTDPRDAQYANALLQGAQALALGVPLWQYAERLTAAAGVGATTLALDTTDVPWAAGDTVFLSTDPYTWEALTVDSVGAGSIALASPTTKAWAAGATQATILKVGRLGTSQPFDWHSLQYGAARVSFSLETAA